MAGLPVSFGEDAIAVSVTLSRGMLQKEGLFHEDAALAHELGHVVLNNSFSMSLEDGMCEYLNNQISPYSVSNQGQLPFQAVFCTDLQYSIEQQKLDSAQLGRWMSAIGKAGRAYPYSEGGADSKIWYYMSHSFVNYLVDAYGLPNVVELIRKGEGEADYEKYLGSSLEELKEEWWNYVMNYESEYTMEDIRQKMLEYNN